MHSKSKLLNALSIVVILTTMLSSMHLPTASAQRSDGIQRDYNAESGKVTRITGQNNEPVELMGAMSSDMTSTERSDVLVERFAPEFGLVEPSEELVVADESQPDANRVVTKYQQVYEGVPVIAGELIVNASNRGALYSMNGEVAQGLSLDTQPELSVETAIDIAKMGMVKWYGGSKADYQHADASLQIFDESLLRPSDRPAELVWKMDMSPVDADQPIRELVLVSAKRGNIPLHFNQIDTAWLDTKAEPIVEAQDEVPPTETPTPEPTEPPVEPEIPVLNATPMPTETLIVIDPTPVTDDDVSASSENVSAAANTLYVDVAAGNDTNACTIAAPCKSIQEAINVAATGDIIYVAEGVYYRPIELNVDPSVMQVNKGLTISGGWNNSFTQQTGVSVVDGQNANNGILLTGGTTSIDRFVVQRANLGDGAGIYNYGTVLTITNSTIMNNHGGLGTAIFLINNASLSLVNVTISNNVSQASGAAIYVTTPTTGTINIKYSTIAFNIAATSGGGLFLPTTGTTITDSIISNNTAPTSPDCQGKINSSNHNIIGNKSGCTVTAGIGDRFNVNPQLTVTLANMPPVHVPLPGSVSIDAANPLSCPANDEIGTLRPQGLACDIGAVELPDAGIPYSVAVSSGANQQKPINRSFANPLVALVLDAYGNPMNNTPVTFTAPASGASGTFTSTGTNMETVLTNESGLASSSLLIANSVQGFYAVLASATGVNVSASFSLQNMMPGGIPTTIILDSGNSQQIPINQTYPEPLRVKILDGYADPIAGVNVTFTAWQSSSTVTFASNGTRVETVVTDSSGIATSSIMTANATKGEVHVNITVPGIGSSPYFVLHNLATPGVPASVTCSAGCNQQVQINQVYGLPFRALVKDGNGTPVMGTPVTFTAPSTGASGTFAGTSTLTETVLTDANGYATSSLFTANGSAGSFTVYGAITGSSSKASYQLQNKHIPGVPISMNITSGDNQQALPGNSFAVPLKIRIVDGYGTAVGGVSVAFTAPASGPSGIFSTTGTNIETVLTDSSGYAVSSIFTAGLLHGTYTVVASAAGVMQSKSFNMTNLAVRYAKTTADGGVDDGDCSSVAAACATIKYVLSQSSAGDTIKVAIGTYTNPTDAQVVRIDKNIVLSGGWDTSFTSQIGYSTIDGQKARRGIRVDSSQSLSLDRFIIEHGYDDPINGDAGGIYSYGTLRINKTIIRNNLGNGIYKNGILEINNSSIYNNMGAGINSLAGRGDINNVTISQNSGPGISVIFDGPINVNNATITENRSGTGGGIYNYAGDVVLRNTILANNKATSYYPPLPGDLQDCYGEILSAGYNIIKTRTNSCTINNASSSDKMGIDPLLGDFLSFAGYQPLKLGSPAINTGNPATCYDTKDQRGMSRVGTCDRGAYEYMIPGLPDRLFLLSGSDQYAEIGRSYLQPLKAVILDANGSPIPGVNVSFEAPSTGASVIFADSNSNAATIVTDGGGVAAASIAANSVRGEFTIIAMTLQVVTHLDFELENIGWYVTSGGNDSNDCMSPETPCATINAAVNKSFAGDTVFVSEGIYPVVTVTKDVVLSGGWNPTFSIQSGLSTIDGQDITYGITISNASATIDHFVVTNSKTGILIYRGSTNPYIGAPPVNVVLRHSLIDHNSAPENGYDELQSGGGVRISGIAALSVENSTISNNVADNGAGIYSAAGTVYIYNSTISGNKATDYGGGIYLNSGDYEYGTNSLTIVHATIANNIARDGGGIYQPYYKNRPVMIKNSILANNQAKKGADCSSQVLQSYSNIYGTIDPYYCRFTYTGQNWITDPKISPHLFGTPGYHILLPLSPAIDSADQDYCLPVDQRGMSRPQGAGCDRGAYESPVSVGVAESLGYSSGSDQRAAPGDEFKNRFVAYVTDSSGNPVSGINVTFTAPITGASGIFEDSGNQATFAVTDVSGIVISSAFTANSEAGNYSVVASAPGISKVVEFRLRNVALYVRTDGDASSENSCTDKTNPCKTIPQAIGEAIPGDTIYVAGGAYSSSTNVPDRGSTVVHINKDLTLSGGWNELFDTQNGISILDGQGQRSGLIVGAANVVVEQFEIVNGKGKFGGGVILEEFSNRIVSLTLRRVSIHDNQSVKEVGNGGMGGGVFLSGLNQLILENSTITKNTAAGAGGGIYVDGDGHSTVEILTIKNSTIVGNTAAEGGSGLYRTGESATGIALTNSILANNHNGDCWGTIHTATNSIIGNLTGCTLETFVAIQSNTDPGLATFSNGVYPLLPTSVAIDSGDLASCLRVDQRNLTRPQRNGCDIGAYEYPQAVGNPVALVKLQGDNQFGSPRRTLRYPFGLYAVDSVGTSFANIPVTFSAPLSGPSGTFVSTNENSVTVSSPSGIVITPAFKPNSQLGNYVVTATIDGFPTVSTNFTLTNVIWYVVLGSSVPNPTCDTPVSPCGTIDQALSKASPGNTVYVSSGTVTGTGTRVITISKDIMMSGGWNSTFTIQDGQTIIDGQKLRQNLMVDRGVIAYLDHFDILDGKVMNGNGAGILNSGALTFTNGAVYNNVAHGVNLGTRVSSDGGGIYSNGTELTLTNVTISNNEADTGGGIFVHSGNTSLNNVTITQNLATNIGVTAYGGGIENKNNSPITIRNTIIAGNSAEIGQDCYNQITSGGNNLIGYDADCDITPAAGDHIGHFNPLNAGLADLSDNESSTKTHALLTGSPAIDAGDSSTCAAADQRGITRPQGAACDIGAFEGSTTQTTTANVRTYTAANQMKWPGELRCDASSPTCTNGVDPAADSVHSLAIATYEFYLITHGRRSIDNNNMPIISTVHYCSSSGCPYYNASWTGAQMIYGDGYGFASADDVVAHELTHGVTQFESNLYYFYQSGAINESFSDLWGEYFDQTNNYGNDTPAVKWLVGEDVAGEGALRNMKNPPAFGDPDKMTSSLYHKKAAYSKDWDSGGVHTNSGVNNKAVYLMVDGGVFNNKTVTALGWEKVGAIYYETQTNLLTSGSDYSDLYFALQQACKNLIGQYGITSATCLDVKDALDAVQMNSQPVSNYNPDTPMCPTGLATSPDITMFTDSFEDGPGNWITSGFWDIQSYNASSGNYHMVANDSYPLSDSVLMLQNAIPIPTGSSSFLYFHHAFGFSYNPGEYYDGAVLEYSTNGGSTWRDARPLFSAGQNYTGTIFKYPSYASKYGSALQERPGFVGDSHGYVSSRYNLTSLAGKTVQFRWRFATDWDYDYMGWHLDDISIYECVGTPSVPVLQVPATNALVKNYTPLLDWSNSKYIDHYELQVATDSTFTSLAYNELNVPISQFQIPTNLASNTKYFWRVRGINGLGTAGKWTAPFSFRAALTPPVLTSPADVFVSKESRPLFDWDAPTGPGAISGYTIQFSKNSGFMQIVHTGNPVNSEYIPTVDLPKNTTLYWRVLAKGANGPSSYSESRSIVLPINPPPTPVLVAPANNAVLAMYNNPTLKWKPITFADASFQHYQVQVATDAAFSNLVLDNSDVVSRATGQLTPALTLTPDTRYYWRVRAVNVEDEVSNWSTVWTLRAAIPAPTLTLPANGETNVSRKPLLDWEDVPGNNGYVLQVWKGTTLVKSVTLPPDVSQYQFVTHLLANTSYTWKVQTKGSIAPSTWSQSTFKTGP